MNAKQLWIAGAVALVAVAAAAGDDAAFESLNPETALADVRASRGVVFVDLYADWCMICVQQSPVVEKLARELGGSVRFVKVQAIENDGTLEAFDASSYPAYILFRDGREIDRLTLNFAPWLIEERLRRMIEGALR